MVTKHYFAVIITHQCWPNVPIKDLETGIAVSSELQNVLSNSGPFWSSRCYDYCKKASGIDLCSERKTQLCKPAQQWAVFFFTGRESLLLLGMVYLSQQLFPHAEAQVPLLVTFREHTGCVRHGW